MLPIVFSHVYENKLLLFFSVFFRRIYKAHRLLLFVVQNIENRTYMHTFSIYYIINLPIVLISIFTTTTIYPLTTSLEWVSKNSPSICYIHNRLNQKKVNQYTWLYTGQLLRSNYYKSFFSRRNGKVSGWSANFFLICIYIHI